MSQPQVIQPGQPAQHQPWPYSDQQVNAMISNSKDRISRARGKNNDMEAETIGKEYDGMTQLIQQMQQEIHYLQNKVDSLEKNAKKESTPKPVKKIPEPEKPDPKNPKK